MTPELDITRSVKIMGLFLKRKFKGRIVKAHSLPAGGGEGNKNSTLVAER